MTAKIVTSKRFSLNSRDWWKGLYMTVGSAVCTALISAFDSDLNFNWKAVVLVGIISGFTYLSKNFFTESQRVVKDDSQVKTHDI